MGIYGTRMARIMRESVTLIDDDEEGKNNFFQGLHYLKFRMRTSLEFQRFWIANSFLFPLPFFIYYSLVSSILIPAYAQSRL